MSATVESSLHMRGSSASPDNADSKLEPTSLHTPPASDMSSHGRKDEDAASSSDLSDLGEEMDAEPQLNNIGAQHELSNEIKPARFEDGIPIFEPTMEDFRDFKKYVSGTEPYGMQSGIVLINPPEEWKRAQKDLSEQVKSIRVKNPITQEFSGMQGIYTQNNMEKQRSYNLPQWKFLCESTEHQPPAQRGERRLNAEKLLHRGQKRKSEPTPMQEGQRRKPGRPRVRPADEPRSQASDSNLLAPPTPTSPEASNTIPARSVEPEDETPEPTSIKQKGRPAKEKGKPGPKPGTKRGPKNAEKADTATSVAARRLHNTQDMNNEVDEEDFVDFDYRLYDQEKWTPEYCAWLEEKYWKSLSFSNPMYGADMPGSLFDKDTKEWNVAKLPNLLDILGQPIPGVNTAYLYLGMWKATFAWHLEDVDLFSINYIHFGAPKQWYSISQADAPKFENAMKQIYGSAAKNCDQFLRHKTSLVSPSLLKQKHGVTVNKVVHREQQFVITYPIGYHSGYNLGYNCAESVNFATENWPAYGIKAKKCECEDDSVFIDVAWFMRRINGEPSPEYEEIEVEISDDDDDGPMDLPTPPSSDKGAVKASKKRKRPAEKEEKRVKKFKKIKIIRKTPCSLCPNALSCEELLPADDGSQVHRRCALYTPETYIAQKDGRDIVMNVASISKDRLELKCNECHLKKGSCFQCSQQKCTRAYHATCAMQAGVQVDVGEISVWHEGVEYRDTAFDWRCKLHRKNKKTRPNSNLAEANNLAKITETRDFRNYIASLKKGDVVQWQQSHGDDIEAGVVVDSITKDEGLLWVKVLPEEYVPKETNDANSADSSRSDVMEIPLSWVLFIDPTKSCLQKPSASALPLPDHLKGKTLSAEGAGDRNPMAGDEFVVTDKMKYEWAEFATATPFENPLQKSVDLNKEKKLWNYIGKISTDSKAQYNTDPSKKLHDPASDFLRAVEPRRVSMAPPPNPLRKYSLAATHPSYSSPASTSPHTFAKITTPSGWPQRHSSGTPLMSQQEATTSQQAKNFINSGFPISSSQNIQPYQRRPSRGAASGQMSISPAHTPVRQNSFENAKPYEYKSKSPMPQPNINITVDLNAAERQKQFQQQAALQARQESQTSNRPSQLPAYNHNNYLNNAASNHPQIHNYPTFQQQYTPAQQQQTYYKSPSGPSYSPITPGRNSFHAPNIPSAVAPPPSMQQSVSIMKPHSQAPPPLLDYPQQRPMSSISHNTHPIAVHEERQKILEEKARIERIAASANASPSSHHTRIRSNTNPGYPFKPIKELRLQKQAEIQQKEYERQTGAPRVPLGPVTANGIPPMLLNDSSHGSYSSMSCNPYPQHDGFIDPTLTLNNSPPRTSLYGPVDSTLMPMPLPLPFDQQLPVFGPHMAPQPPKKIDVQSLLAASPKKTIPAAPPSIDKAVPQADLSQILANAVSNSRQNSIDQARMYRQDRSTYQSPYDWNDISSYGYGLIGQQKPLEAERMMLAGRYYSQLNADDKDRVDASRVKIEQ